MLVLLASHLHITNRLNRYIKFHKFKLIKKILINEINFNLILKNNNCLQVWDFLQEKCIDLMCDNCTSSCVSVNCTRPTENETNIIQGYMTLVCLSISIVSLVAHIIKYHWFSKRNNLPRRILNSLAWSMLLSQTLFLFGINPVVKVPDGVCRGIAVLLHLFFLATIFWTNVISFDIWQTFSSFCKERSMKVYDKYVMYAWCGPLLLSSAAIAADFIPQIPDQCRPLFGRDPGLCWFANSTALAIYFFFPASFLILVNIFLFIVTVYCLHQTKAEPAVTRHSGRKECVRFWVYTKLSLIMGLSWACAIAASFTELSDLWYPFIILNSLQGAFIFIMFNTKRSSLCDYFLCDSKFKDEDKPQL